MSFKSLTAQIFVHENCARTTSEDNERDTVTENLQEVCGEGTVYLAYDYETPFFESTYAGQIRLVKQDHRYIKYYDASGTIAFRFDSVLSHFSMLHGAYPDSPCSLKPGQLLPAEHTDEAVRGGVYFYGSLHACPKSGPGHWMPSLQGEKAEHRKQFCSLGVISVLKVTKVIAGPTSKKCTVGHYWKSAQLCICDWLHCHQAFERCFQCHGSLAR